MQVEKEKSKKGAKSTGSSQSTSNDNTETKRSPTLSSDIDMNSPPPYNHQLPQSLSPLGSHYLNQLADDHGE